MLPISCHLTLAFLLAQDAGVISRPTLRQKLGFQFDSLVSALALSTDGKLLATRDQKGNNVMWDLPECKERLRFSARASKSGGMTFDKGGDHLIAFVSLRPGEGKITYWETAAAKEVKSFDSKTASTSMILHPDGKQLASAVGENIEFRDVATGEIRRTLKAHLGGMLQIAFNSNGTLIGTAGFDKLVKIINTANGEDVFSLKGHAESVYGISFSPNGPLLASGSYDKTVKIWDTKSGDLKTTLQIGRTVSKVAFSPNGKWLAVAGGGPTNGAISIHEADSGREVFFLKDETYSQRGLFFNPAGTLLATAGGKHVRVWEFSARSDKKREDNKDKQ